MNIDHLPTSTTDRLMAVADVIEAQPDLYHQDEWWVERRSGAPLFMDPTFVYGKALEERPCRTTGCIAGWAVALSPLARKIRSWPEAGAEALGISPTLGQYLFSAHFEAPAAVVADMLRRIARLPEGERTIANMPLVLSDDQLRRLVGVTFSPAPVSTYVDPDDDDDDIELFPTTEPDTDDDEGDDERTPDDSDTTDATPTDGNGAHPDEAPLLIPA